MLPGGTRAPGLLRPKLVSPGIRDPGSWNPGFKELVPLIPGFLRLGPWNEGDTFGRRLAEGRFEGTWRVVGISGSWGGFRAWKGVCLLVCLIEKGEGEKGSGLCSGGTVGGKGDLKSGLGNRVFAKGDGGDFVKASTPWCRVVPPPPSLARIPGLLVCTSTFPKSTREMALTVVCRVVSSSKLVLGVVARVLGFWTKVGGLCDELVSSSSSSSTRNLGCLGSPPSRNGLHINLFTV